MDTPGPLWPSSDARFVILDLRSQFSAELLSDLYHYIMRPMFPIADELDPLSTWEEMLTDPEMESPKFNVQIFFERTTPAEDLSKWQAICGVVVWEFYTVSNCCLMSYFVTTARGRGKGLASIMVSDAFFQSKKIADPARQFYFFAETNKHGVHDGVMKSGDRHLIMRKIGFSWVQCMYIQPPLDDDKAECRDLLLLVYTPPPLGSERLADSHNSNNFPVPALDSVQPQVLEMFLDEFWRSVCAGTKWENSYRSHPAFVECVDDCRRFRGIVIPVQDTLPWGGEGENLSSSSSSSGLLNDLGGAAESPRRQRQRHHHGHGRSPQQSAVQSPTSEPVRGARSVQDPGSDGKGPSPDQEHPLRARM